MMVNLPSTTSAKQTGDEQLNANYHENYYYNDNYMILIGI